MSRYTEDIITYILNGDTDRAAKAIYNIPSDSSLTLKQKLLDEALVAAVNKNNKDIVRVALKNGANPNYVNSSSYFEETLLEIATQNGNDDIIKLLTAAQTVGTTSNSSSNSSSSGGTSNSSSSPDSVSNEIPTNNIRMEQTNEINDTVNKFGGRRRKLKKAKKSRKVKKSKNSRKSKKGKKYTRRSADRRSVPVA